MLLTVLISFLFIYTNGDDSIESPSTRQLAAKDDRIIGGQETTIEAHPYQVSFLTIEFFCGGFIVSQDFIITVAHCVESVTDPSTVVLRAGNTWRRNGTVIPIAQIIPHPEHDNSNFNNDVAIMKTVDPIQFTATIQPIPLAEKGRPMETNTKFVVSGWGKTKREATTLPEKLMDVEIPVVDHEYCNQRFKIITENMFCGGTVAYLGQGICEGDSGGPAVQDGKAVGISLFTNYCFLYKAPSVFTNIAAPSIRDFITQYTGL